MSKINKDDVLALARLSRLRLSDEEVDKFSVELTEILNYVKKLDSVDVAGLAPTYQVTGLTNQMRNDEVKDYGYKPEALLEGAPAKQDNQFKVKRVLK
jgi:aspartyl-tRNA(Asn)/glutamyl-tRNA(Gln) amidotransferase subunit C